MNNEKKDRMLLSKILGELYRMQVRLGVPCPVSEGDVYGLLEGFDWVIDECVAGMGNVTEKDMKNVAEILDEYFLDDKKLEDFKGYYDIEDKLKEKNIDRTQAIRILRYFNANGQYMSVIDKMNSDRSPVEAKRFDLSEFDK